jgi:hypothetical protein
MTVKIKNITKDEYYNLLHQGYRTKDRFADRSSAQLYAFDIDKNFKDVVVIKRDDEVFYYVMAK